MGNYVIVRAKDAGVFAGNLESKHAEGIVNLRNSRRLWYWKGAASLSQLAMDGVKYPNECKFPCEVSQMEIFGVIEILQTTEKAEKSIKSVPIWSA